MQITSAPQGSSPIRPIDRPGAEPIPARIPEAETGAPVRRGRAGGRGVRPLPRAEESQEPVEGQVRAGDRFERLLRKLDDVLSRVRLLEEDDVEVRARDLARDVERQLDKIGKVVRRGLELIARAIARIGDGDGERIGERDDDDGDERVTVAPPADRRIERERPQDPERAIRRLGGEFREDVRRATAELRAAEDADGATVVRSVRTSFTRVVTEARSFAVASLPVGSETTTRIDRIEDLFEALSERIEALLSRLEELLATAAEDDRSSPLGTVLAGDTPATDLADGSPLIADYRLDFAVSFYARVELSFVSETTDARFEAVT